MSQMAPADAPELDVDFVQMQRELYTAAISDVLDSLGYRQQVMEAAVRPLDEKFVIAGSVRTALSVDVYNLRDDCYDNEIAFVDSLMPDDVVVAATNHSLRTGFWGELLSTAASARGATGAVTDGCVRDVRRIRAMGFPVFAGGIRAVDSRGRSMVLEYDTAIECGAVTARSGDVVFGDIDGVVIIPRAVASEAIALALEKVRLENVSRNELEGGQLLADVYQRHGVL
jgi:4-hydroxy-4-methyl-2-oxoglutarate aldolase